MEKFYRMSDLLPRGNIKCDSTKQKLFYFTSAALFVDFSRMKNQTHGPVNTYADIDMCSAKQRVKIIPLLPHMRWMSLFFSAKEDCMFLIESLCGNS